MKNTITVTWKHFESFYKIDEKYSDLNGGEGIYLWVYKGKINKVVYVGTGTGTDGLFRRLCTEKAEMLCGKHYCFKYNFKIDPYEEYLKKEPELIRKKVEEQLFYYPDSGIKNAEEFSTRDFLNYQNNLSIFTADLTEAAENLKDKIKVKELSKILETQIQVYLLGKYDISYYRPWGFQSWLGRVEKLRKTNFKDDFKLLLDFNFAFSISEIPDFNAFETSQSLNAVKEKLRKKL